jgi:hypothetical protein
MGSIRRKIEALEKTASIRRKACQPIVNRAPENTSEREQLWRLAEMRSQEEFDSYERRTQKGE